MTRTAFLLVLASLLIGLFLQFRPIDDVDLFWQVRTGELMLESRGLMDHDQFTYTHHGDAVPPIGWLAQVLFALQLRLGSWEFVRFGTAMALAAALVVAAWPARHEAGWFSVLAAVALGLLVILPHSSVRPQAYGALGFALLLTLARSEPVGWHRLALAVPLLVVWQNLHPSVAVGAIAVAALAAARWWHYWSKAAERPPWEITLLLLLVAGSQFATPLGWDILAVSRQNALVSRDWLGVSEWQPPWDARVRHAVVTFWLALGLSGIVLGRLRLRVAADDLLLFASLTVLALTAARFGLFWAVAMVPIWARWIERAKPAEFFTEKPGAAIPLPWAAVLLGAGGVAAWIVPPRAAPLFSQGLPSAGLSQLAAAVPTGRVYNYREWGGPLVYRSPRQGWQVAIDGRLYLFSREEWDEYNRAAAGQIPLHELVERHRPDAFFLRPTFHEGLTRQLRESADWREAYADDTCAIFVPTGGR